MTMVAAGKSDGDPPQAWKQDPAQTGCPGAAVLAGLAEQFVDDGLAQRHGGGGVLEEHIQLGEGDGAAGRPWPMAAPSMASGLGPAHSSWKAASRAANDEAGWSEVGIRA